MHQQLGAVQIRQWSQTIPITQFYLYELLDSHLVRIDSSGDEGLDLIPISVPKYQLGLKEEDSTFFSVNKVCFRMTYYFLDMLRYIFRILESIGMMPQVLGINWTNPIPNRVTLFVNHIFAELRLPFLPIIANFLTYINHAPSRFPLKYYRILLSYWIHLKEYDQELTITKFTFCYFS